mgnify:CR=1 FL=1
MLTLADGEAGLVHGDLKRENVVRGPEGRVVLLDVGNSNHDDELRAAVVDAVSAVLLIPLLPHETRFDRPGLFHSEMVVPSSSSRERSPSHQAAKLMLLGLDEEICTPRGPFTASGVERLAVYTPPVGPEAHIS